MSIFGRSYGQRISGQVSMHGKEVDLSTIRKALASGLAYVTEDRKTEGFFETMSIAENLYSGLLAAGLNKAALVSRREMRALAAEWRGQLNIRAITDGAKVIELSGGNQQKVVIGKWLATEPKVVILDEPTKGIDVGSKAAVHQFIGELVMQGLAVIMVSSELPEVLGMADRIIVMHQGRIRREFARTEATTERVAAAAMGAGG